VTERSAGKWSLGPEVAARLEALGVDVRSFTDAAFELERCFRSGGKVLLFGNGGSAADAQHVAAEFVGRFELERPALPAIALGTNGSALTAIANDFGFEHVFARQIEALGRPGDVAIAISTSGASANVLEAVAAARRLGLVTIGLSGPSPSPLAQGVQISIRVPGEGAASIQEAHLVVEHALCRAVEMLIADEGRPTPLEAPGGRIVTLEDLLPLRETWSRTGRTVVWTNGVFDVLHIGHLRSLEAARGFGDVLVVGVNGDTVVTKLKGPGRPIFPLEERMALVAALRAVDYVVAFEEETPERILSEVRPDVHCKGEDYAPPHGKPVPEREVVESYGGRIEFVPLVPSRSTTDIVERIVRG
jgi:phosphoheptose isomerase